MREISSGNDGAIVSGVERRDIRIVTVELEVEGRTADTFAEARPAH